MKKGNVNLPIERYSELIKLEEQHEKLMDEFENSPSVLIRKEVEKHISLRYHSFAYSAYLFKVITDKKAIDIIKEEYVARRRDEIVNMSIRGFIKLRKKLIKELK